MYRHNITHCKTPIASEVETLKPALAALKAGTNAGAAPLLLLPSRTDDLDNILAVAAEIKKQFSHVIVVGAGGSGLSGRTLAALKPAAATPLLYFLENIDPDAVSDVLARGDVRQTHFIVISKSGTTAETLAHFYALLNYAKPALGKTVGAHFTVITSANKNPMRETAQELGMRILDHPLDIGGRFAILTMVGLLPAALAGLDIKKLRRGAQTVIDELQKSVSPADCQPAVGAALHVALAKEKPISVFLPYAERLSGLASWWRQCWAESLGKSGKGTTPIRAVGTTDQHSQLQLYLDGPKDKFFHLVLLKRAGTGQKIVAPNVDGLDYLQGKTTGDIIGAEQKATLETLVRHGSPVRVFELDRLAEEEMGALIMHLTLEVIFTAALLNINPFDQPAVEEGKRLAREYLLAGKA
jgi:glucose-6-phosphate isomerase